MAKTWQDVKKTLDTEYDAIRFQSPSENFAIFRHRIIDSGAGTHGQCMSAWVFIAGDTRYLAFYGVTNVCGSGNPSGDHPGGPEGHRAANDDALRGVPRILRLAALMVISPRSRCRARSG